MFINNEHSQNFAGNIESEYNISLPTNLRKGEKPEIAAKASRKKYRYQQTVERKR
jgi:hypothetical protein